MTSEEQHMLGALIGRVQETQLPEKDPEAEQMLAQSLGRSPDALYVLAQTVLIQNMALGQAQAQIRQLQQQRTPPPARAVSFLGNLLGHHDPPAPPPQLQYSSYAPPQYGNPGNAYGGAAPVGQPPFGQPQYGQPQYAQPMSGAGGFLRSAATTAAGVAAGALAFEGIESLMHGGLGGGGFGGGGFGRSMGMGGMGGGPMEETVINNYYDEPGSAGMGSHHEHPASFDDRGDQPRVENADYLTAGHDDSPALDTSGINSDLDDSIFNDPGSSGDSSSAGDFSGGDDSSFGEDDSSLV